MAVVGVWVLESALTKARELLPRGEHWIAQSGGALVADTEMSGHTAVVGHPPTESRVQLTDKGLVLRRGPAWNAPLYYRVHPFPAASSHLAPLVRGDDDIDSGRLATLLGCIAPDQESRTVYKEIRSVRPFETVVLGPTVTTTDEAPPRVVPVHGRTIEQLAGELNEHLLDAVSKAAGTRNVCVAVGGLDSSSILAALLAVRGVHFRKAMTLDFHAPGSDQPYIRALEVHYGISITRIRPGAAAPPSDVLLMDAAPSRHAGDMWSLAFARHAHSVGGEMVMSGLGGDELFGGVYGSAGVLALRDRDARGAFDVMRARFPFSVAIRKRVRHVVGAAARPWIPHAVRRLRTARAHRRLPEWAGSVLREEFMSAAAHRRPPQPVESQAIYRDLASHSIESDYCAEPRAQLETVAPVPRVDPLYDNDLVGFLAGVPHQALFAGGMFRGLLRTALRPHLPERVRLRLDKSDFEPAMAEAVWPIERFRPLLTFEALDRAGIVRAEAFQRYLAPFYVDPHGAATGELWTNFWPALCAEAFLRTRSRSR